MKIIIECTPEEARHILGLPNLALLQKTLQKAIEATMEENIGNLDPLHLAATALSMTFQGWGAVQKAVLGSSAQRHAQHPQRRQLLPPDAKNGRKRRAG
jgi:hypothetical protein